MAIRKKLQEGPILAFPLWLGGDYVITLQTIFWR